MPLPIYFPKGCNPIHAVRSWMYVRQIIRAARRGEVIPAIVIDGENLLTGTHRMTANNLMVRLSEEREMSPAPVLIPVVQLVSLDLTDDQKELIEDAMQTCDYGLIEELLKNSY